MQLECSLLTCDKIEPSSLQDFIFYNQEKVVFSEKTNNEKEILVANSQ